MPEIRCFRSLFSLLLAAVLRCYLVAVGFTKPGFLWPGEVSPLYFPGINSGISERGSRKSEPARDWLRILEVLRALGRADGHHWSRRCPVS
jgi:hypothetical protein